MSENLLTLRAGSEDDIQFYLTDDGEPLVLSSFQNIILSCHNIGDDSNIDFSTLDNPEILSVIDESLGHIKFSVKTDTFTAPNRFECYFKLIDENSKEYFVPSDSNDNLFIEVLEKYV